MTTKLPSDEILGAFEALKPDADDLDSAWYIGRRQRVLQAVLNSADQSADATPEERRHPAFTTVRWVGMGLAVAAGVAAIALVVVPSVLRAGMPVPAEPAATPDPVPPPTVTPQQPSPEPTTPTELQPTTDLAALTVSTAGWKTFSSPEYPVTFQYPAEWTISFPKYSPEVAKSDQLTRAGIVDGCDTDSCGVYAEAPSKDDDGAWVGLFRTGFIGDMYTDPHPGAWPLVAVPELQVWKSADLTVPASTATVVVRSSTGFTVGGTPKDYGPPYDYLLSTADRAPVIAVGESNPLAERPQASFAFEATKVPEEQAATVVTILTSIKANPDFNPTQPAKDGSGRPKFWMASMDAPQPDVDSSGWKTVKVPEGNISLRVPPKWKVKDYGDGIRHLTAPSGYILDVLTNGEARIGCRGVSEWAPAGERVTSLGLTASAADGVAMPVELWWQDATWHPAEVWLTLVQSSAAGVLCSQSAIDYGGEHAVYMGSADNLKNPSRTELNQAVAILASVERLT